MPFSEESWRRRVTAASASWPNNAPTDEQALPFLDELFKAPKSYWNFFNIRSAIAIESVGHDALSANELGHGLEEIWQAHDDYPTMGKAVFKGRITPSNCLIELFTMQDDLLQVGLLDENYL